MSLAYLGARALNWAGMRPRWGKRAVVSAAEGVIQGAIEESLHEAATFIDGIGPQVLTEHNRFTVEE
jgi:hypothetical protein